MGWWIMTREFGRQNRLSLSPAASKSAPMLAAWPTQSVLTSGLMIHQPMGGFQGQATDIEIHAKEILYLRGRLNEILAKHTGKQISVIERDTERDFFMGAPDAVKYGIADKVLVSRESV